MDTVEANIALGFNAELRGYQGAVDILKNLGAQKIKLMTNNPSKVKELENAGFDVEALGHSSLPNEENRDYLKTKASKMNHKIDVKD